MEIQQKYEAAIAQARLEASMAKLAGDTIGEKIARNRIKKIEREFRAL